jgi:hypothetical protein
VRDGVKLAHRGIPAVALVTDKFWAQGDFVARSAGMPDIPRTRLPHPVAGSGHDNMTKVASQIAHEIVTSLSGGARQ